jgi:adenosylcobyric acid synthase
VFETDKSVRRTEAQFDALNGPWAALSGVKVQGYEIHHGKTVAAKATTHSVASVLYDSSRNALAWQNESGNVLGVYLHGLFEDKTVLQALFGHEGTSHVPTLDSVFDGLADYVEQHFEAGVLRALIKI